MVLGASCYGDEEVLRVENKMNGAKYGAILEENLLLSTRELRLRTRSKNLFQQVSESKHTAKVSLELLKKKSLKLLQLPSSYLSRIGNLQQGVKTAAWQHSSSNLMGA